MKLTLKSLAFAAIFAAPALVSANAASGEASHHAVAGFERSFSSEYKFDKRDGWMTVDASANGSLEKREILEKRDVETKAVASSNRLEKRHKHHKRKHHKRKHHHTRQSGGVEITWYTGSDMNNPYCFQHGGFSPHANNMVAAVTMHGWKQAPKCGQFVQLCNGGSKCATVRIVDMCAGCQAGTAHVDLSQAAFEKLAPLSAGVVNHIQMRIVSAPHNWSAAVTRVYGPQHFT